MSRRLLLSLTGGTGPACGFAAVQRLYEGRGYRATSDVHHHGDEGIRRCQCQLPDRSS